MITLEKVLAGFSILIVADLFQVPLVRGKVVFSQFSDKNSLKYLLGLQLWHLFKYAEIN